MSKRPFSPKSRAHARPLIKRCPSGGEVNATAMKAAIGDINLPPELCDDSLLHVLSYADTSSLVHFTRGTNNAIRDRCRSTLDSKIWKDTFENHNLAPLDIERNSNPPDYYNGLRRRLTLFSNLSGKTVGRKKLKHSYNLPSRFFHFVPILPSDFMHYPPASAENNGANDISFHLVDSHHHDGGESDAYEYDDSEHLIDLEDGDLNDMDNDLDQTMYSSNLDPPPVEFSCDSYSLTSAGTGSELVFLNPFSGTIEVRNVLDNAVGNDESILEQAMLQASERIVNQRQKHNSSPTHNHDDENSEIIAGEAFHRSSMYDTPPKQVLYSVDDYFDLDLNEYFGEHTPFKHRRSSGNVTSDWVGVDSHSALSDSKSLTGTFIGAARILTMEPEQHGDEELACTEVFAWSNFDHETGEVVVGDSNSSPYCFKHVVKVAGSFYFLDVCANKLKVFASFQAGSCPFEVTHDGGEARKRARSNRAMAEINDNDSVVNEDGEPIRMSRTIFCLPLIKCDDSQSSTPESIRSKFPVPDSSIKAQYPVSSFSIDPTGNILVVGTVNGTVEIWDTSRSTDPRRTQLLSVRQSFLKRHRAMTLDERNTSKTLESVAKASNNEPEDATMRESSIQDDIALLAIGEEEFPHKHPTSKISQIYLPRHLTAHKGGFVTKQRNADNGTTLLLWQTPSMFLDDAARSPDRFQITAMINAPLSAQCHPEVHYDGRRLLVFGKDHIGLIILVYHVLGSRFDQDEFNGSDKKKHNIKGEESGGVINLVEECRVKFVNRIRHAGLDGLEYFDSMLMTANERYIVINTKAGHLIGCDGRNASEGLLVIDLEDSRSGEAAV
eukprot:scaffold32986_cov154-Skeletonema_menzelii.AAC.4